MSDYALSIVAIILSAISVVLTIFMINLSRKEIVNRTTRYSFIGVLITQILMQCCLVITYQIKYIPVVESVALTILLCAFYGQFNVILNVLRIFSVLDDRITPRRLNLFRNIVIGIFLALSIPTLIFLVSLIFGRKFDVTQPFDKDPVGYEILGYLWMIVVVIIDQTVAVYVTILIFKHGRSMKKYHQFVKNVALLAGQVFLDYSALSIEFYQLLSYDGLGYQNLPNRTANLYQIVFTMATFHFALSVFTFMQFKKLFLAGKVVQDTTSGTKSAAPVKLLDVIKKERADTDSKADQNKKTVIFSREGTPHSGTIEIKSK